MLGRITVGDGVRIGANSVVTRDVPSNAEVWPAPVVVSPSGDGSDEGATT